MGRLLFFLPNVMGGVYTYTINLVDILIKKGFVCSVITYGNEDILQNNLSYTEFIQFSKYDSHLAKLKKILKVISLDDVIIANDSFELDVYSYFKLNNPIFYILHGAGKHYSSVMKRADFTNVFCDSDSLREIFGNSGKKIAVLYPIVPIIPTANIKQNEFLTVGFVGRLEVAKGADLIYSFDQIYKPQWEIVYPKIGSDLHFVDKLNRKSCYSDVASKDVQAILGKCHFLFFPSKEEGFGMAVLEAMRIGVVPIVRDIDTGIMPLLTHKENCIKFTSQEDLKLSMDLLIIDKSEYNRISSNAIVFSSMNFDTDKQIDTFCETLKGNLNNREIHENIKVSVVNYLPNRIFKMMKIFKKNILRGCVF